MDTVEGNFICVGTTWQGPDVNLNHYYDSFSTSNNLIYHKIFVILFKMEILAVGSDLLT